MTLNILELPLFQATDANGDPLAFGKLYSFLAGTSTPQALLAADGTTPLTNPVVLDISGMAQIRLPAMPLKLNLLSATNVQQVEWPIDNVLPQPLTAVPTYTVGTLPTAGSTGRLAAVTDSVRGLWLDSGAVWASVNGRVADVRLFGAVGDGTTDDTTAIKAARDSLTAGGTLYFPAGTYRLSANLGITVSGISIRGAGVGGTVLQALAGVTSTGGLLALGYTDALAVVGASNLTVSDLTLDGNNLCRPLQGSTLTNALCTRLYCQKSLRAAAQFFLSTDVTVSHCTLFDSNAADQFGDGLYFGGCVRPQALYNHVEDFKRIGIVTEASGSTKSYDPLIVGNFITNAHDNTAGEYNAGIWCENTNSARILHNKLTNLYNTPAAGQLPRGIVINGGVDQTTPYFHLLGNDIEDVHQGIYIAPGGTDSYVLVEGNIIRGGSVHQMYRNGIYVFTSVKSVRIKDNFFGQNTFDAVTNPGNTIVLAMGGGIVTENVHIENNQVEQVVHYASSADIHATALFTATNMTLLNQSGKILCGNTTITRHYITNCRLSGDNTAGRPLAGTTILASNSSFTVVGSGFFTAVAGGIAQFTNCLFYNVAHTNSLSAGVSPPNLNFTGCFFSGGNIDVSGPVFLTFDGCQVNEYRTYASGGFLKGNSVNAIWYLRVRNCDFVSSTSEIPLKLSTFQPTNFATINCTSPAGLGTDLTRGMSAGWVDEGTVYADVIATASLPAAGTAQNGRLVIEDNGAGDRNLIIYAGGQRFRIDGGANV